MDGHGWTWDMFLMCFVFSFFYIRYKFRGHYLGTKSYMTLRLRRSHIHWPLWPQQRPEQINLSEPHTSSSLALVLALMLFLFCVFCSWYLHTDASSITNLYLFPSRTRCDRRYHANPTRIGCLIRRRRSYLCSRRFGEHSALIDVLGIFWLPASPFKCLLKSGFLIQWWCLEDSLIKSSCFMGMCRLPWVMPISGSV